MLWLACHVYIKTVSLILLTPPSHTTLSIPCLPNPQFLTLHSLPLTTVLFILPSMTISPAITRPHMRDAPTLAAAELITATCLCAVKLIGVVGTVRLAIAAQRNGNTWGRGSAPTLELILLTLPRLCQRKDKILTIHILCS